ncbi:MAG: hypothetical protein D6728_10225 [Cyanobacteria bacterium J055]|nr:MAG: hypothetical protein D6728_10225 [Cyanobacteria bacterium J055]
MGGGAGAVIGSNIFGQGDRAVIQDFQNGFDNIQTPNGVTPLSVVIGSSRFLLAQVTGGFEIVAQVVGFTGTFAAGTFIPPEAQPSANTDRLNLFWVHDCFTLALCLSLKIE